MRLRRTAQCSLLAASLVVTGCADTTRDASSHASSTGPARATASEPAPTTPAPAPAPAPVLIGSDCSGYTDAARRARVAREPVLDVIREDPRLSRFAAALTGGVDPGVDYTQVLTGGRSTVFAPTDDAAAALSTSARTDPAELHFLIDYHIVPGRAMSPQELLDAAGSNGTGDVQTLQGWRLAVFTTLQHRGDLHDLRLSEDAVAPVCGGITTADATLYLVPQLLHPPGDYTIPGAEE